MAQLDCENNDLKKSSSAALENGCLFCIAWALGHWHSGNLKIILKINTAGISASKLQMLHINVNTQLFDTQDMEL